MKKILSIITACITLLVSCTKDAPAYPSVAQTVVIPPAPVTITDNISPNPCTGTFTIHTNTTDSQTVVMYDMMGRLQFTLIINGTTAVVDNGLTNGIYMLEFITKTGKINKRLVVQR
jgi:hypothetical protein